MFKAHKALQLRFIKVIKIIRTYPTISSQEEKNNMLLHRFIIENFVETLFHSKFGLSPKIYQTNKLDNTYLKKTIRTNTHGKY